MSKPRLYPLEEEQFASSSEEEEEEKGEKEEEKASLVVPELAKKEENNIIAAKRKRTVVPLNDAFLLSPTGLEALKGSYFNSFTPSLASSSFSQMELGNLNRMFSTYERWVNNITLREGNRNLFPKEAGDWPEFVDKLERIKKVQIRKRLHHMRGGVNPTQDFVARPKPERQAEEEEDELVVSTTPSSSSLSEETKLLIRQKREEALKRRQQKTALPDANEDEL
ncbi:hypothetical protein BASA81_006510 [Batrachochytrium salamandrivorans]|nr:hypothetical protein BASA81_006510 [Batrachochytrium salamandrivorans]